MCKPDDIGWVDGCEDDAADDDVVSTLFWLCFCCCFIPCGAKYGWKKKKEKDAAGEPIEMSMAGVKLGAMGIVDKLKGSSGGDQNEGIYSETPV